MIINDHLLKGIHPSVYVYVTNLSKTVSERLKGNILITEGYRSLSVQEAYYAQGRHNVEYVNELRRRANLRPISENENVIITNAKPGQSAHNWYAAVDLYFNKDGTTYIKTPPPKEFYDIMLELEKKHNSEIGKKVGEVHLGLHFGDPPHVEYKNYRNLIASKKEPTPFETTQIQQNNIKQAIVFDIVFLILKIIIISILIIKKLKK